MLKIKNFLKKLNIERLLGAVTELYLIFLILLNLSLIVQTDSYFGVGKYALAAVLSAMMIVLIELLQRRGK